MGRQTDLVPDASLPKHKNWFRSQKVSEILRFENFMDLRFRNNFTHENHRNSLNFYASATKHLGLGLSVSPQPPPHVSQNFPSRSIFLLAGLCLPPNEYNSVQNKVRFIFHVYSLSKLNQKNDSNITQLKIPDKNCLFVNLILVK